MISNRHNQVSSAGQTSLTLEPILNALTQFLDEELPDFFSAAKKAGWPTDNEAKTNQSLSKHLNFRMMSSDRPVLYKFLFTPDEILENGKKPDLGVTFYCESTGNNLNVFYHIECKRLPTPNPSKDRSETEYVIGTEKNPGAIERFKDCRHGSGLKYSSIIGYVENKTTDHWFHEINRWILTEISKKGSVLKWTKDDLLKRIKDSKEIVKANSICYREKEGPIELTHFLLLK